MFRECSLQIVEMMIKEKTLDCVCKQKHHKKLASVFQAIRRVDYYVVVGGESRRYLRSLCSHAYITDMTTLHMFSTVAITEQPVLHVTSVPEAPGS